MKLSFRRKPESRFLDGSRPLSGRRPDPGFRRGDGQTGLFRNHHSWGRKKFEFKLGFPGIPTRNLAEDSAKNLYPAVRFISKLVPFLGRTPEGETPESWPREGFAFEYWERQRSIVFDLVILGGTVSTAAAKRAFAGMWESRAKKSRPSGNSRLGWGIRQFRQSN